MSTPNQSRAIHGAMGVLAAVLSISFAAPTQPAAAQGFFEALFGEPRYVRPEPLPPHARSYADPFERFGRDPRPLYRPEHDNRYRDYGNDRRPDRGHSESSSSYGRGTAFCVRTCDGRYFPLQRHAGASAAELCRSFCPASKTMVFSGSKIDYAVGPNGRRYASLENAFAYRDRVVKDCTCNGKDPLGLARVDPTSDPTLRPGDIVVTNDGFAAFRGTKSKAAQFTPVDPSSKAWARYLSEVEIRPSLPADEPKADDTQAQTGVPLPPRRDSAAADAPKQLRRAQLDR